MCDREQILLNVIQEIIYAAKNGNDICRFGEEAADILKSNGLLEEPVYNVLTGKL